MRTRGRGSGACPPAERPGLRSRAVRTHPCKRACICASAPRHASTHAHVGGPPRPEAPDTPTLPFPQDGVFQHFNAAFNKDNFLRTTGNKAAFWSCVDSRSELPLLGTPGGDTAE
jgi:hypothetical protein